MEVLPTILEYGLTGLAAIIVLLAYRLLQQQNSKDEPHSAMLRTIKGFMALGIVLALISAGSNYIELSKQGQREQVKGKLAEVRDSLSALRETTSEERRALNRLIADYFSSALRQGEEKVEAVPSSMADRAECTLVRRAVFKHMRDYDASREVLQNALNHFVRDRGFSRLQNCAGEIVADFDRLRTMRLRWLEDEAIPALDSAMANASPVTQQQLSAKVPLPDEFVIDEDLLGTPTVKVKDMTSLEAEVDLLKRSMD